MHMANEQQQLGNRIATLRRTVGLPQRVLAEAANCSQPRISSIEQGKLVPNTKELRGIERVLGVLPRSLDK